MKVCIHLYSNSSEYDLFFQILNVNLDFYNDNILDYNNYLYQLLDDEAKKDFNNSGLEFGKYKIISSKIEQNAYWGELSHLYLRAIV